MSLWNGNLKNSLRDILIDSVLIFLIIFANFLQISHLLDVGSTDGISPTFLFFNALFNNLQLADTLLLATRAWPTATSPVLKLISNGELRGARLVGAVLGLVQVALQWMSSMVLVTICAIYASDSSFAGRNIYPAYAFVHATLSLFPALAIALPALSPRRMDTSIFIRFSFIFPSWLSLVFLVSQFFSQFLEFKDMSGSPGSLSLSSFGVRAVTTILVAVRWLQRLGAPTWHPLYAAPLTMWFEWGWLPFNYVIEGTGCAILFGMYF